MRPRSTPLALLLGLALATSAARAAPNDTNAQADAYFRSAKSLRAAGKYPEACAAFAESKRLAPGIGVSLYLADCYEHVGKNASASAEFHDAEKLARERNDKRADVAYARAVALEPRLGHIGVANPLGPTDGADASLDGGAPLALAPWTALAVDPGDHSIVFRVAGRVVRQVTTHVEAGRWAIVRFDPPQGAATSGATGAAAEEKLEPRRVAGYTLMATGFVGVAAGAGLLALKNQSLTTGAPNESPTSNQGAAIGSDIAFGVGGAAFVSAIVLYLSAPTRSETALVVTPVPLAGGAGGVLSARF